jgi:hypothetical protein
MMEQYSQIVARLVVVLVFAGLLRSSAENPKEQVSEVHQLFLADQADRESFKGVIGSATEMRKIKQRDRQRQARVRQLLVSGALKTGQDYRDAAFIFQHGDQPDDYLLAHTLAMASVVKGDQDGRWIAAATLDRYLQSLKKPQIFGTQYSRQGTKAYTQEPFNRHLVTDDLREVLCVPRRDQQGKDLDKLNKNLTPEALSGCM